MISTFFLGLSFNWIAYKTKSIRWSVVIHGIISFFALGKPHITIIYDLFFD
ncbi:MAG: CPBP family glutamic-type intramembrane protease [Candidatus Hodarchaeales archaeon]